MQKRFTTFLKWYNYALSSKTIKTMKITSLFLIIGLSNIYASVFSQNLDIDLNLKNVSLKECFENIEQKSTYKFLYRPDLLDLKKVTSIEIKRSTSLDVVLTTLLNNTQITYNIINNNLIVLSPIQQTRVSGIITDASSGVTLPGVIIRVEGTSIGVTADENGKYNIRIQGKDAILVFSYLGYIAQRIPLNGQTVLDIKLVAEITNLNEVVVIGYGTQKKISVTGAISTIKTDEILRSPVSSVGNALAGRASGITTVQRSGEPGRDVADIYIRGIATFAGGNSAKPLILVDGVERSISDIDPYTIESMNILKDASATAVFGVRGANGVIIITTKTGESGKPQISFSSNLALQNPIRLPQLLNAEDYAILRNQAEVNDTGNPNAKKFSDYDIERYRKGDDPYFHPNINWMDYMLKKYAPQQQYNFNVSGGTKDARYFVSLGYLNQEGDYKLGDISKEFSANPNFKRYNLRSNFDFNITKNLSLSIKSGTQITKSNYSGSATSDIFGTILSANPLMTPVLYDGKIIRNVDGLTTWNISNTPLLQMLSKGYNTNFSSNFNFDIASRYKLDFITTGLALRGKVAYDSYYRQQVMRTKQIPMWDLKRDPNAKTFADSIVPVPILNQFEGPVSFNSEYFSKTRRVYAEAAIEYNRSFERHSVSGLFLGTTERYFDGGNQLPFNYMGIVGRLTYNYNSRYFFDLNMGYNGSENFAKGKQFGLFPAASAGYILSDEPFFPKSKYLSYLKLRSSYGLVGNDKIGGNRFLFLPSSFALGNTYYFGTNNAAQGGYRENTIGNPDVTWETAKKFNVGVDLRLFEDKLTVSVDYFTERRSDILWNLNVPVTFGNAGLISPYNIGSAENKGYELEVGYKNMAKSINGVSFWINGNFSFARNKILYQDETPQPYPGLYSTGNRIGQPKGLIADGLYNTMDEINDPKRPKSVWEGAGLKLGDIKYVDVNSDGIIDDNDRVNIGNPNIPEIIYGTTFGASWKGIELSVLFQGTANVSTYLAGEAAWPFIAGTKTAFVSAKESWTQDRYDQGLPISLPILTASPEGNKHNYRTSTFWQQDASYIRLKNLEIAYSFNSSLIKSCGLKNLRVYANGQNILTWTKLKCFDPEIANSNGSVYPMVRVFNIGFTLQF